MIKKKCSKCGIEKSLNDFCMEKRIRDWHQARCKLCSNKYNRIYRANNPKKIKEAARQYREKNRDRCHELSHNWYKNNSIKVNERSRKWRIANKEKSNKAFRDYGKKIRKTPKWILNSRISNRIRKGLINGKEGKSWKTLIGFTINDFKKHIEKKFLDGMNWENKNLWEIDHIIPLSVYNYKTPRDIDFFRAWDLSNLRPLWKPDNRSKGKRLSKPFQPSLNLQFISKGVE